MGVDRPPRENLSALQAASSCVCQSTPGAVWGPPADTEDNVGHRILKRAVV
jgi:hypothetical protein